MDSRELHDRDLNAVHKTRSRWPDDAAFAESFRRWMGKVHKSLSHDCTRA